VLGHGKFTFPGAGAAPIHVLHASTQGEHRSPAQNSGMGCLWCVQLWHLTCWKASSVEIVGKVPSKFHQGLVVQFVKLLIGWDSDFAQGRLWNARMVKHCDLRLLI
jgi:hypothetical protein